MPANLPRTDHGLLAFASNFNTRIASEPASYGLLPAQATKLQDLFQSFDAALTLALEPITRTKSVVANKCSAAKALRAEIELLTTNIEAFPSITESQLIDLGLSPRKKPTPIPAPEEGPVLDVISMNGHEMKVRLHGSSDLKARPWNAKGANVFTLVAPEPSDDPDAWQFYCTTTQRIVTIDFPQTLTPGTQVYVTAFWYSPRGESSPAGEAVGARINFGTGSTASLKLKKAA